MGSHMRPEEPDRRGFLKRTAAAWAAVTAWAGGFGQRLAFGQTPIGSPTATIVPDNILAYGQPSPLAKVFRLGGPPGANGTPGVRSRFNDTPLQTPLDKLDGIITPNGLHFLMDHIDGFPDVDPAQHRLIINGMVDRPLIFTMDELKRFPSTSHIYFLECNANGRPAKAGRPHKNSVQMIHGKTSCSEWTGVLLSTLLKEAGVQRGGSWIIAEGADAKHYVMSIPMEKAMDNVLVAYSQNGEPVRPQQGFPLRLVVPGWEAIRSVKWLRGIKVTDQLYSTQQETANNADMTPDHNFHWFKFEQEIRSVITRPSGGYTLPGPGFYEITGLAWTGAGLIKRVEVSTDNGRTWKDAALQQPVLPYAHVRFRHPWTWNGEETVIMSRATDERGQVQPTIQQLAKLMNVPIDYFFGADHCNCIQLWKINRDGSIEDAVT